MAKSWEQILGGYATNTLTEEEKRVLFEAALEDQAVFDALADEEALRELLANPEARQRILESLQASGASPTIAETHSPRLQWYRQPSSLAWAGSMAAMGLALLFGWQMEAIWGPVVQEELQAEREISREKDDMVSRSQSSRVEANKSPVPEAKNKIERETAETSSPSELASSPSPAPAQEPPVMAKAPKGPMLRKESPDKILSDRVVQPQAKKEMVSKAQAPKQKPLKSTIATPVPQESQARAPSMESPTVRQEGFQQLPQAQTFADRMPQHDAPASMGARDLSSSKKGRPSIGEQSGVRNNRAPQQFGGMASDMERAYQESSSVEQRTQASRSAAMASSRGIRYRFIQRTADGKETPIAIEQFHGNLANVQLGITSTIPGYLYVMTEVKKGNWQWLKAETQNLPRSADGAIHVIPNEPVVFSLGPIPNDLGRPFISSVTVLLSTTPILDLGNWLGVDQRQEHIYQPIEQGMLVLDQNPNLQEPFRVRIQLGQ